MHHTIIWARFVCLFPYSSQVLRPIWTKLGMSIEVDLRIVLEVLVFRKVKVIGIKGHMLVSWLSFIRFGPNLVHIWGWMLHCLTAHTNNYSPRVKVIGVKGHVLVSQLSFIRFGPNLVHIWGWMLHSLTAHINNYTAHGSRSLGSKVMC